jgi:hypothetical protein
MVSAFMAVPLGIPLIFMTGGDFATMRATLVDPAFRTGIAVKFVVALWSWLDLRRAVDLGCSADALRLKRRFALVFLRAMPGGAEDADPLPAAAHAADSKDEGGKTASRRRRRGARRNER